MAENRREDLHRRVRGLTEDGRVVVDSDRVELLYGRLPFPVYCFPEEDLASPLEEGRILWRGEGRVAPRPSVAATWLEEDEVVGPHPRDPYHRVDTLASRRRVVVRAHGSVIAESSRAVLLYETSLPVRPYLPRTDVRAELLRPSDATSACPYKGEARYWDVHVDGHDPLEGVCWSYELPLRESQAVAGLWCFWSEKDGIEVEVEGFGRV
jgi:uncharacterized protein (DUF427 family)